MYREFHARPGNLDGPGSHDPSTSTWAVILEQTTIRLTTEPVLNGAQYDRVARQVQIDIDDSRVTDYDNLYANNPEYAQWGSDTGRYYVLLHEIGHADPAGQDRPDREAFANTMADALADYGGFTRIPNLSDMPEGYIAQ